MELQDATQLLALLFYLSAVLIAPSKFPNPKQLSHRSQECQRGLSFLLDVGTDNVQRQRLLLLH
jgi:hypothetical protein